MPELPEVETIATGVDRGVRGDFIESAWFSAKKEPFKTLVSEMERGLIGRRILQVYRVGKHIVCDLASAKHPDHGERETSQVIPEAQWIVHLGMTGRLLVCVPETPAAAHTHAVLGLASGRELRFVDPRRFGRLAYRSLAGGEGRGDGFRGPGREPLSISPQDFAALFQHRHTPIKAALLNQKLLQGVGNIYADESLFRAGIRPRRLAGRLTRVQLTRLHSALITVLREAIALGGSSVSDYVNADGVRGFFQLEHRVYQRTNQPCQTCSTPIRRILIGGRGTHFCPRCQV